MKIKWLVDTFATVEIGGKLTQLLMGEEYVVTGDSEYFQTAIARGWAEVVEPKSRRKEVEEDGGN